MGIADHFVALCAVSDMMHSLYAITIQQYQIVVNFTGGTYISHKKESYSELPCGMKFALSLPLYVNLSHE
jgi:hypothetical protein